MQLIDLTPKEEKLYTKLVKEYQSSGLSNICSLDSYLAQKYEHAVSRAAKNATDFNIMYADNVYNVWQYAQNDF